MSRLLLPVAVVLLVCLAEVGLTGLLMKSNGKQHEGAGWTLTREFLLGQRRAAPKLDQSARQHIALSAVSVAAVAADQAARKRNEN